MKNILKTAYYGAAAAALLTISASCNEVLDINSTNTFSDQAVWSSELTADQYVTASYNTFNDMLYLGLGTTYFDSYADIMKNTNWDARNNRYNKVVLRRDGIMTGSAGPFDTWGIYTTRIRRANVCYNDIDRYGVSRFGKEWSDIRKAEVRFCNAINYWRLARVYGGVILRTPWSGVNGTIDDGAYDEDIHRARATEEETWQFILDELDFASKNLPDAWEEKWTGRATKKTAYAFLSRIALYAQKWDIAAAAAEKVKELGGSLVPVYADLFDPAKLNQNRNEILYVREYLAKENTNQYDQYMRPFYDSKVYATTTYAEHVPTAELADMYEYADGTTFSWDNWKNKHADPYTDREPRFHATILYNGAKWENRTIETFVGASASIPDGTDHYRNFELTGATDGYTCTGYYMRKFLQPGHSSFASDGSYNNEIVLRYAEVLLNKAEAYAMMGYSANSQKALNALNEVRARVNLPAKTLADAPDLDSFMAILRNERCCELAGEGFRYWDLRRWRLSHVVLHNKSMHGTKVTKLADGTFSYESVDCDAGEKRSFIEEKDYKFSIPVSELTNNKKAVNNPGW